MEALCWLGPREGLRLLDQRKLPQTIEYITCMTAASTAEAIRDMVVRGAPAIGIAAAYGMVLSAAGLLVHPAEQAMEELERDAGLMRSARPTAVNLMWAVDEIMEVAHISHGMGWETVVRMMEAEALSMHESDVACNRAIGQHGQALLKDGDTVLTHCNAGALATAGFGTALGVIRAAVEAGKHISVYADETRPYLQGARLTVTELMEDGIPVTLICDNMAGYFMQQKHIACAIVGADRIAANGDTANKIGTLQVAILCRYFGIPFYVAAPLSTMDRHISDGSGIPIEFRSAEEITHYMGIPITPKGARALHPGFDVTPSELIHGIITEAGILRPPYRDSIRMAWEQTSIAQSR